MTIPKLTIRSLRSTAVVVPMARPLGTSAQTIRSAPLLLIDLETEEGVTGHTYLFCYLPMAARLIARVLDELLDLVKGDRVAPHEISIKLGRHFRLIGMHGIISAAVSGLDVACWDALAVAAKLPLATFLGGTPKAIPAYNSNGLGIMTPEEAANEAEELLADGFRAIKLRLGYPTLKADLSTTRAIRNRLADDVHLMADFNQALTLAEALLRGRALEEEGLFWIEEPIRHDDYIGCATLASELATPIQIGENFAGSQAKAAAIDARAADYMMPDLERIGGVTGWQRAASLAAAAGIELSSHLYPEVSAHLLAVSPTSHWLEYIDWATPILAEPLRIVDGAAIASDRPGVGLSWNEGAIARYRIT